MANRNFDTLFPPAQEGGVGKLRPNQPEPRPLPQPAGPAASPHYSRYQDRGRYQNRTSRKRHPDRRVAAILVGIGLLAALSVGTFIFVQGLPASITLNGALLDVGGDKTLQAAMSASGAQPRPGDLIAVDGSVLEAGRGEPFHATINGQATNDPTTKLSSGDIVELGDGQNIEEPSDAAEAAIPYGVTEEGRGAIHVVEGTGTDGRKTTKTGTLSGLTVEQIEQEPMNVIRRNVTPNVGADKVIALTFDDGPWPEYTAQILDVLAKHDAKATFFTVGNCITGNKIDLVKRAASEGHQICTHSFDHAAGSGKSVNLGLMTPDEQIAEIEKGYAAIEAVTGQPASHIVRTPGGNYGPEVVKNISPLVSYEIGWNIDSRDWKKPGANAIASEIQNAWPGAIVLLHDGGGNRSQTVDALKIALPRLKEQGYRFVTMDELLSYPLA